MLTRRGLITGLISLVAAPAIVKIESLMPVKVMPDERFLDVLRLRISEAEQVMQRAIAEDLFGEQDMQALGDALVEDIGMAARLAASKAFMPRLHREQWRVRGWEVSL